MPQIVASLLGVAVAAFIALNAWSVKALIDLMTQFIQATRLRFPYSDLSEPSELSGSGARRSGTARHQSSPALTVHAI